MKMNFDAPKTVKKLPLLSTISLFLIFFVAQFVNLTLFWSNFYWKVQNGPNLKVGILEKRNCMGLFLRISSRIYKDFGIPDHGAVIVFGIKTSFKKLTFRPQFRLRHQILDGQTQIIHMLLHARVLPLLERHHQAHLRGIQPKKSRFAALKAINKF
jgi:hypothetical protein